MTKYEIIKLTKGAVREIAAPVVKHGFGARIPAPAAWIGKRVKVTLIE